MLGIWYACIAYRQQGKTTRRYVGQEPERVLWGGGINYQKEQPIERGMRIRSCGQYRSKVVYLWEDYLQELESAKGGEGFQGGWGYGSGRHSKVCHSL